MRCALPLAALAIAASLLAGCAAGGDDDATSNHAADAASLPQPEGGATSVTGMPDPGTATPTPAAPLPAGGGGEVPIPPDVQALPAQETATAIPPTGGGLPPMPAAEDGPGAEQAVAVLRDYYAAINIRDFAAAYRLWRPDRVGQSASQFEAGFADTLGVSAQFGPPGPVDAGAGQRHIEIPATITATRRDDGTQRFRGTYVLQRTVVDGASDEQRQWRIVQGDLRRE